MKDEQNPLEGIDEGTYLVGFGASWCGPWSLLQATLDELESEGFKVKRIDADKHAYLADRKAIVSLPTFIVFKDGREVKRKIGALSPAELKGMIR